MITTAFTVKNHGDGSIHIRVQYNGGSYRMEFPSLAELRSFVRNTAQVSTEEVVGAILGKMLDENALLPDASVTMLYTKEAHYA